MKNNPMGIVILNDLSSNNKNQNQRKSFRDGGNWQVLLRAPWFACCHDPSYMLFVWFFVIFTDYVYNHSVVAIIEGHSSIFEEYYNLRKCRWNA